MIRGTWVYDETTGELVTRDEFNARQQPAKRSRLAAPMLIRDCIETKSMADGKIYTSKAALRRSYRERGYAEVGTDPVRTPPKPKADRKAIRASIMKAKAQVGL